MPRARRTSLGDRQGVRPFRALSALQPASKIGHPSKGKIWLKVNGTETQKGDLTELIWNVPEIIWQLSQQVALAAGDIIMTGTPAGVVAALAGDKIECGVDGVGTLKVIDRQARSVSRLMSAFEPLSARRDAILALLFVAFLILNCVSMTAVLHSSTPRISCSGGPWASRWDCPVHPAVHAGAFPSDTSSGSLFIA